MPRENLLGRLHGGWEVAITVLMYERMALGSMVVLHHFIERVLALARSRDGAAGDPVMRQRLAELYIGGRLLRLTGLRYLTRQLRGEAPGAEGSVLKLGFTESYRQMAEIATQLVGPYHQLWQGSERAIDDGRWAFQALGWLRVPGTPAAPLISRRGSSAAPARLLKARCRAASARRRARRLIDRGARRIAVDTTDSGRASTEQQRNFRARDHDPETDQGPRRRWAPPVRRAIDRVAELDVGRAGVIMSGVRAMTRDVHGWSPRCGTWGAEHPAP